MTQHAINGRGDRFAATHQPGPRHPASCNLAPKGTTMKRLMTLAALALLAGCAGPAPRGVLIMKPNQSEAQAMAWGVLGGTGAPPAIYWVEGGRLDCADIPGLAWQAGASDCHRGETHDGEDWSDVAYPEGVPLSDGPQVQPGHGDWTGTSMVHEMAHHLGVDPIHSGPLFARRTGGPGQRSSTQRGLLNH